MIVPFLNGEMFDVELVHGRKDEAIFDQNKNRSGFNRKCSSVFCMIKDITETRMLILN
jgi:hypothetical protein